MKDDYLTLRDKEGKLITQAQRSKNRLYKVVIDIVDSRCLQLSTLSDSQNWHARLGHIGRDTMNTMIKKELVIGIPKLTIEKETCSSCLLGKQARKTFPQATSYHATRVLELIHGDLCGQLHHPRHQRRDIYLFLSMIIKGTCGQYFSKTRHRHLKNLNPLKPS